MLKDTGKVALKETPFTKKDERTGKQFELCKYWVVIDGNMFPMFGYPDYAEEGDVVPLTVKADQKGFPKVVFAKPL